MRSTIVIYSPPLTKWGGDVTVERDWDYLAYWIEEAERLDMKVIASLSVLGYGYTKTKEGLVYEDDRWNGKTQEEMPDSSKPDLLVDMRDQTNVDAVMLNPAIPEVQVFIISIIEEIATKYPKLKGICLDYCRWYGGRYGFGDATIAAFEAYSGVKVNDNNQIITSNGGVGPLYKHWIEFRSMTITNFITNISSKVKGVNPDLELHLWASADWRSRYIVGQNWASKNTNQPAVVVYIQIRIAKQVLPIRLMSSRWELIQRKFGSKKIPIPSGPLKTL